VDVADFDYELPEELIAQAPLPERDASRLLVLPRREGQIQHRSVRDLPALLAPGDLLVANDARVIPARLRGRKQGTGGKVELLLVEPLGGADWLALGQAAKPLRAGQRVEVLGSAIEIVQIREGGELVVRLPIEGDALWSFLDEAGELPLPPYIRHAPGPQDRERYQTVFARERGSVAAPTAGLHFTPQLIARLAARGIETASLVLHVGPGTFRPVEAGDVRQHRVEPERLLIPPETAEAVRRAREERRRVVAVGTTATRALESAVETSGGVRAGEGETALVIVPGYRFRLVDALLTNFHLPRSSLLLLASAFAGRERVLAAYAQAVASGYRFYSYGDAMLVI
jgi:S-adenosylmethionine:tRNA ribosyltransferase-isomerase